MAVSFQLRVWGDFRRKKERGDYKRNKFPSTKIVLWIDIWSSFCYTYQDGMINVKENSGYFYYFSTSKLSALSQKSEQFEIKFGLQI
jgi:hypothetical protein